MESNVLMRRAAWCGVVFALAIILTFLNFMPPVSVKYHVRSKVVVSESRLEVLRKQAVADRLAVKQDVEKDILLLSVKILDLAEQEHSADSDPTDEKVVLIEVGTLWGSRCTAERHYHWLNGISKIAPSKLGQASAAQAVRSARWALEAAEHYQAQFAFLAAKEVLPPESPVVNANEPNSANSVDTNSVDTNSVDANSDVANSVDSNSANPGRPRTFQLASYTEASSSSLLDSAASDSTPPATNLPDHSLAHIVGAHAQHAGPADVEAERDFELRLNAQVDQAKERLQQAEQIWMEEIDRSSGTLQIAGVPVIASRSTSIPFWMAASILILGLAAGSTAGWCQHRGHSGGAFQASQVAERLALHSLPTAARLVLSKAEHQSNISRTGPLMVARVGHGLTRLGEWGLTFWVLIAASRFFLDSAWRDVLVNSPLAAFGRLLAGMP